MSDYEKLDRVYAAHPEIKELVAAAVRVVQLQERTRSDGPVFGAVEALKTADMQVDNRDWLK